MQAPDQSSLALASFPVDELAGRLRHNARREPADEHIDRQRSIGNRVLLGDNVTEENGRETVLRLAGLKRFRKNAVLHELIAHGTAEMKHNECKRDKWGRDVLNFAEECVFGVILRADMHVDEATPHIHLLIVPTAACGVPDVPEKWQRGVWGAEKKFCRSKATKRKPRADAGRLCGGRLRRGYLFLIQEKYANVMQYYGVEPRTRNAGVPQYRREQFSAAVNAPMPEVRVCAEDIPDPPLLRTAKAVEKYKRHAVLQLQQGLEEKGLKVITDQARYAKLLEGRDRERKVRIEQANDRVQKAERNLREANERIVALQLEVTGARGNAEELARLKEAQKLPCDRAILFACGAKASVQSGRAVAPSGKIFRVVDEGVFAEGNPPVRKMGLAVIEAALSYTPVDAVAFATEVYGPEIAARLLGQKITGLPRRVLPPPPPREDVARGVAELNIPLARRQAAEDYLSSPEHYLDATNNVIVLKRSFSGEQEGWLSWGCEEGGFASTAINIGAGCAWSGHPGDGKLYIMPTVGDFIKGRALAAEGLLICNEGDGDYLADLMPQRSATSVAFCGFEPTHPSVQVFQQRYGVKPELILLADAFQRAGTISQRPGVGQREGMAGGYSRIIGPDSFGI